MDDNKTGKGMLLFGLFIGAVVGAATALLTAPKSGRELRNDIRIKKDEYLDDTSEYLEIAKTKATDLINEGKKKSEKLISDAKEKATSLIKDANSILNQAKVRATGTAESTKDTIVGEAENVKEAFKAGVEAYNQEKSKGI